MPRRRSGPPVPTPAVAIVFASRVEAIKALRHDSTGIISPGGAPSRPAGGSLLCGSERLLWGGETPLSEPDCASFVRSLAIPPLFSSGSEGFDEVERDVCSKQRRSSIEIYVEMSTFTVHVTFTSFSFKDDRHIFRREIHTEHNMPRH